MKTFDPILLLAVPLGVAFLLPLVQRMSRRLGHAVHVMTLGLLGWILFGWGLALRAGAEPAQVVTGGWAPPVGINLRLGPIEVVVAGLAVLIALGAAFYLRDRVEEDDGRATLLQLLVLVGALGLTMTRDFFNLFVFLEISSIGTYALAASGREREGLEAGFKYMLIGSAASAFLLIGIAFLYKLTGTLNLDDMAMRLPRVAAPLGVVLAFLWAAWMIELKQVPVNGPAIDLYDGVHPGVMGLLVGTTVNGALLGFWKVLPLIPEGVWTQAIVVVGATTFVVANFLAIAQTRTGRLLGWSSSGQIGLLVMAAPFVRTGDVPLLAAGLLLVNHTLAKVSLLWLSGWLDAPRLRDWRGQMQARPGAVGLALVSILALAGLPPFPGFWGKWDLLRGLAQSGHPGLVAAVLVGSLAEFVFLFGWVRRMVEEEGETSAHRAPSTGSGGWVIPVLSALLVIGGGVLTLVRLTPVDPVSVGLAGTGLLLLLLPLPGSRWASAIATIAIAGAVAVATHDGSLSWTRLDGVFGSIVLGGALVFVLAAAGARGLGRSFIPLFLFLVAALWQLVGASTLLGFFFAFEWMTWTSGLLVFSGRRGGEPGLRYMVFSGAAGFLVLGGMMVTLAHGVRTMSDLSALDGAAAATAWVLMVLGLSVKGAAWGVHVWAPDAYAEAPDAFTPFLSGVVSKMPILGFVVLALAFSPSAIPALGRLDGLALLAWLGGATALGMTLLAVFQDDLKRTLAYSSVGQVGYIVVALAVMTPLGWTAAIYHAVNHLLFKGLLFLAIAGVIQQTGARRFHELGGLITRMPLSFVSVLIGIIALAGVPPLSGFGGKWLVYHALLERGWVFLMAVLMFASVLAFLYCFRLIHNVFLGQLKTHHRNVREVGWPQRVAQGGLIVAIMALSVQPQWLLRPLQEAMRTRFGTSGVEFVGQEMVVPTGSYQPLVTMMMVMALFVFFVLMLFVLGPRPRRVGQLDIVYSGEIPPPPEEIHYASDFYRPYARALGPLLAPAWVRFWEGTRETVGATVDVGRRIYSGNGQTYVLYAVLTVIVSGLAAMLHQVH